MLQQAIARTTLPWWARVPSALHRDFLFLLIVRPRFTPSWLSPLRASRPLPTSFSPVFPVRPAHAPIHGAVLTSSMSCFWPCWKEVGEGLMGQGWQSLQSWAVCPGLHTHCPSLADSRTATSLLSAPFTVSPLHRSLYLILCFIFSMFRYANTYHCTTVAYSFITITCCTDFSPRATGCTVEPRRAVGRTTWVGKHTMSAYQNLISQNGSLSLTQCMAILYIFQEVWGIRNYKKHRKF